MNKVMKYTLKTLAALAVIAAVQFSADARNYTRYVNPFVGTDGHGHTSPSATYPFGMVQAGPDTRTIGWDGCSGYHYSDTLILGFTHTHLSGTGCLDYGDILFMPYAPGKSAVGAATPVASRFSHEREKAEPGYYQVWLENPEVDVQIAAGRRVAMHEYAYSDKSSERALYVDLRYRDRLICLL